MSKHTYADMIRISVTDDGMCLLDFATREYTESGDDQIAHVHCSVHVTMATLRLLSHSVQEALGNYEGLTGKGN